MALKNRPLRIKQQASCLRMVGQRYFVVEPRREGNVFSAIKKYLASLPSCEPWLENNPDAKASVERGLQQAKSGEVHDLGSFAQYADLEIDD